LRVPSIRCQLIAPSVEIPHVISDNLKLRPLAVVPSVFSGRLSRLLLALVGGKPAFSQKRGVRAPGDPSELPTTVGVRPEVVASADHSYEQDMNGNKG
jgi:hypothetical protein